MGFEDICTAGAGSTPLFGGVLGTDWKVLVFVGLLITLGCLAVLYMIGNFLRNSKLLAWVNSELFQVFATAVLAMFIIAWIGGLCAFPVGMMDDAYANRNLYQVTDGYIHWGEQIGKDVFLYSIVANYFIGLTTGYHFNFDPLGVGSKMTPLGAFSQVSNLTSVMMSTMMVSYLILITQKLIIEYIRLAMLYFFLPLGLLMRALSPTREFGGAMVGLSIALLVFYPLTIVFNDMIVRVPIEQTHVFQDLKDNLMGIIAHNLDIVAAFAAIPVALFTGPALSFLWVFGVLKLVFMVIQIFMRAAIYYFLIAVVLPIFNFIFIIAITKDLSKVLGDEVDVTNLTRMI